jgi:hypothetical protein
LDLAADQRMEQNTQAVFRITETVTQDVIGVTHALSTTQEVMRTLSTIAQQALQGTILELPALH